MPAPIDPTQIAPAPTRDDRIDNSYPGGPEALARASDIIDAQRLMRNQISEREFVKFAPLFNSANAAEKFQLPGDLPDNIGKLWEDMRSRFDPRTPIIVVADADANRVVLVLPPIYGQLDLLGNVDDSAGPAIDAFANGLQHMSGAQIPDALRVGLDGMQRAIAKLVSDDVRADNDLIARMIANRRAGVPMAELVELIVNGQPVPVPASNKTGEAADLDFEWK